MFHQSLQEEMYNYCVVYPPCKCRHPVQMVDTENISLLDIFQCRAGAARLMHGRWRRSLTSCNECSMLPPCRQWYARVRQRSVGNTTRTVAGRAREDHLQAGCHGVPLPAWSGTSIPRQSSRSSLWRRFPASSLFCEPTTTTSRTSLSTRHVQPSGFLANSIRRAWFRQF